MMMENNAGMAGVIEIARQMMTRNVPSVRRLICRSRRRPDDRHRFSSFILNVADGLTNVSPLALMSGGGRRKLEGASSLSSLSSRHPEQKQAGGPSTARLLMRRQFHVRSDAMLRCGAHTVAIGI